MRSLVRVAAEQQALVVVLSGSRLGHRTVLGDRPVEIGRGSSCELILDADSVSRRHARIERFGGGHKIVDLGSTNGTYLNGIRIHEQILRDGDRLQIGKALLKYIAGGNIEGAYHEEIQRLTRFDPLTGVFNKRHFEESLKLAIFGCRSEPRPISLVVYDLDHFKRINDTHGHMAGDAVLCEAAAAVREVLAPEHVLGRVGGEEFAVLCSGLVLAEAAELAERIRQAIGGHRYVFEGKELPVTVSLGVAERALRSDETAESLFERADERLYEAKGAGRNCVRA
jgi:diguanylate cyclase (GGDEF)-like protein